MPNVERIDPEEDAERVPLPEGLKVVYSDDHGLRFHLPADDGKPVCDRGEMIGSGPTTTVAEARAELGLSACRSCFTERRDRDVPDTVMVAIGNQAEVYHRPDGDGDTDCGHTYDASVLVEVPREKAERAMTPCTDCWSVAPDVPDPCPLCGEAVGKGLNDHLAPPEGEGCPETPAEGVP